MMQTILIVDDDKTLCSNVALALNNAGYRALTVFTGMDCLPLIQEADLLLLDIMLPDTDGFSLCTEIRTMTQKPIIFLTSCEDEMDVVKGLDIGADDYITKPFRLGELISRVRAALRRASQQQTTTMPDLPLTAVEQRLLTYLMEHMGQYVTREQLLRYLWDSKGCFVNDNTLSVHISRLREKLRAADAGQITTQRGLGYQWKP